MDEKEALAIEQENTRDYYSMIGEEDMLRGAVRILREMKANNMTEQERVEKLKRDRPWYFWNDPSWVITQDQLDKHEAFHIDRAAEFYARRYKQFAYINVALKMEENAHGRTRLWWSKVLSKLEPYVLAHID
jgi:hypothetical protein